MVIKFFPLNFNTAITIPNSKYKSAIIIGVRKCGTRALLAFCGLHPKIVHADREVHFFNSDQNYRKGLGWYKRQMPFSQQDQITMEKTPGYFIHPKAPTRIKKMNKDIKLIIVVRDPIERIVSDWVQVTSKRGLQGLPPIKGSLENRIIGRGGRINRKYRAVRTSMYLRWYKEWIKYFKQTQILIVDGSELRHNPWKTVKKVEKFLGLPPQVDKNEFYYNETRGFYCMTNGRANGTPKCLNESKGRLHPHLNESIKRKLRQFYERYNRLFFNKIGSNLGWNRP